MKLRILTALSVLLSSASIAADSLNCQVGPIHMQLGGTQWQVTSCDDGRSLVFAAMADNPAMPFVFFVIRNAEASQIHGEGNGSKEHSAAAFDELKTMTESRFDELVQDTKQASATQ